MPYDVDSPPQVASKYSPKCRRAFVHAFNSVHEETDDEGKAMAAGHAAARQCEGKRSAMQDIKFTIVTGLLKAFEGDDGIKRLKTTASSTVVDLGGDQMELSALESMAATAKQNMTIFLNHKYQVPEDVLGSVENAMVKIVDGGGVYDLDFDIRVEESNDRAVKAWQQIQNGTKLGCSIGARIPDDGYEKTDTGMKIKDIHLMEASIVGIPANPRSFVQYAMKALHEAEREAEESEETADLNINLNLGDGLTTTSNPSAESVTITASEATLGEDGPEAVTVLRKDDEKTEIPADPELDEELEEAEEAMEVTPTTESDVTEGPDAESDSASGDEPSQEADKSVPESDGVEDEDTRAVIAKGIETLESLLIATKDELVEARKVLAGETEARVQAERERDEAREDVKLARSIVERINALPIGRRTSFKAASSEFHSKFAAKGIYDDEVLQLLERESDGG